VTVLTDDLVLPLIIITLVVLVGGGMLGYVIGYSHGGDHVESLYRD